MAAALAALLTDLRIHPIARVADPAFGPSCHDPRLGGAAPGARSAPGARVAGPADQALGTELPQIEVDLAAACAARPDHWVTGAVQDVCQAQQHRRAVRIARGERVG